MLYDMTEAPTNNEAAILVLSLFCLVSYPGLSKEMMNGCSLPAIPSMRAQRTRIHASPQQVSMHAHIIDCAKLLQGPADMHALLQ